MLYGLIVVSIFILYILYKRYMPVAGVHHQDIQIGTQDEKVIVDLRDYNNVHANVSEEVIHIPIAYIKRKYQEIPDRHVHIIVDNEIEKNMGVRLLRRKGINVVSYTMNDCCSQK